MIVAPLVAGAVHETRIEDVAAATVTPVGAFGTAVALGLGAVVGAEVGAVVTLGAMVALAEVDAA